MNVYFHAQTRHELIQLIQHWLDRYYKKIECLESEKDKLILVNRKTNKDFIFNINFDNKHINYQVNMYYVDKDLVRRIADNLTYGV